MSLTNENIVTCSSCGEELPMGLSEGFCPKCALESTGNELDHSESAREPSEVREKAPERIGKYRILKEIGEGGFGIVYMAEQKEPVRRRVALKVLKRGMDTRQVVTRFELERQALAMMDHPNVARVLDGGETEDGRPFFAMEYVDGVPITKFCDDQQMTVEQRLELLIHVCRGLQHAHQKGLIHRDVKPPNILVTMQDGRPVPKIIDFGIAKVTTFLTQNTLFTDPGKRVGTPVYMSPEQLRLDSIDVDVRTDIYSMGALLYEVLSGATPFDHKKLMANGYTEMERTIREQDPPKPSARLTGEDLEKAAHNRGATGARLKSALRGELDWIVMRAMAKGRERRYQSASDLADDLTRYMKREPVKAGPPTLNYRASRFVRRHRGPLAAGAATLIIAITLIAYTIISRRKAEEEHLFSQRHAEETRAVQMLTGPKSTADLLPFALGEVRPHLDRVAGELETIASDPRREPRARLHAAIAVLPLKPKVMSALIDELLALDPTEPKKAEHLEDCLTILERYRVEGTLEINVWSSLKERAWKEVPPPGVSPAAKGDPLAAIALLAQFDRENARWKQGLLREAISWTGSSNPIRLSQFRQLLDPVLERVQFNDPILRFGVSTAIGITDGDPIMDFDLLTLREVRVESKLARGGIRDLTGLEQAVNLEKLDLDANEVANIDALREMTRMKELDMQANFIADISPLSGMKHLKMLDIRNNRIADLSPLEELTNLEELQLSGNDLSDPEKLKPLEKLVNLKLLEMEECKLSDLSFLAKLTKLEEVRLKNNNIRDLTPLAKLINLEYLDLNYNKVTDPNPLLDLPKIRELNPSIQFNPIPVDVLDRFHRGIRQ